MSVECPECGSKNVKIYENELIYYSCQNCGYGSSEDEDCWE